MIIDVNAFVEDCLALALAPNTVADGVKEEMLFNLVNEQSGWRFTDRNSRVVNETRVASRFMLFVRENRVWVDASFGEGEILTADGTGSDHAVSNQAIIDQAIAQLTQDPDLHHVRYLVSTDPFVVVDVVETEEATRQSWVEFTIGASDMCPLLEMPEWVGILHSGMFPQWDRMWGTISHLTGVTVVVDEEVYVQEDISAKDIEGKLVPIRLTYPSDHNDAVSMTMRVLQRIGKLPVSQLDEMKLSMVNDGYVVGAFASSHPGATTVEFLTEAA